MGLAGDEQRVHRHAPPIGELDGIQRRRRAHEFHDGRAFDTHAAPVQQRCLFRVRFEFALREIGGGPPVRQQHGLVRG
ncbi:hypothetical protein G6F62_015208 [Rhizopus arrhizus]|nr:hypothetical protein G6F62_015208 [Rhizopus arrhizus]KAG1581115.1 hypothetical protein G6F46_015410 [Rhizopus delemar]